MVRRNSPLKKRLTEKRVCLTEQSTLLHVFESFFHTLILEEGENVLDWFLEKKGSLDFKQNLKSASLARSGFSFIENPWVIFQIIFKNMWFLGKIRELHINYPKNIFCLQTTKNYTNYRLNMSQIHLTKNRYRKKRSKQMVHHNKYLSIINVVSISTILLFRTNIYNLRWKQCEQMFNTQNSDIFGNYICDFFNECVFKGVFHLF